MQLQSQLITEAMGNIDINDSKPWHDPSSSDEHHNEFYDSKDDGEGALTPAAVPAPL